MSKDCDPDTLHAAVKHDIADKILEMLPGVAESHAARLATECETNKHTEISPPPPPPPPPKRDEPQPR